MKEEIAVVRNVQNNQLYMYLGENKYRNMVSGAEGEIEPEKANKIFKINLSATAVCNEFPLVQELIKKLNLTVDTNN